MPREQKNPAEVLPIVRRIKAAAEKKGWGPIELARETKLAEKSCRNYMSEKTPQEPGATALSKIAAALDVTVDYLVNGSEQPQKLAPSSSASKRFDVERSLACRSSVTVEDIGSWHPDVGKEFIREFFRTVRETPPGALEGTGGLKNRG